ncbi:MAG: response regulator [Nitrospinae bacterium]|nr:response regulator [Nitrospinota bacterium]
MGEEEGIVQVIPDENSGLVTRLDGLDDQLQSLRESSAKNGGDRAFRELVENAGDTIYTLNANGEFTYVSPHSSIALGYGPDELIGSHFAPIVHPDELPDCLALLKKLVAGETRFGSVEYRKRDKGGNYHWYVSNVRTIDTAGELTFVGIARDISERKRAEADILAAKNKAESATKLKDKFVSLVAHDLRSPISLVLGALDTVRHDAAGLPKSCKDLMDISAGTCGRLVKMIDQLLNISRLQTGCIMPVRRFMYARSLADLAVASLSPMAEIKKVRLINQAQGQDWIYGDYHLLYEVLENLVTNAIKFTRAGDTITIFSPDDEPGALAVKDTGVGIPAHVIPNLLRHEVKTTTTGTGGEPGTGLGLPLCKDIMEAHGGSLAVESEAGKGSVFRMSLPPRIPVALVMAGDSGERATLGACMERAGIKAMESVSGHEALDFVRSSCPDVVITDMEMPGLDGIEFLSRLKEAGDGNAPRIIAVTDVRDKEVKERAFAAGAADIITKPVDENELIPRVKRLLIMESP